MIVRTTLSLLVAAGIAAAQQGAMEDAARKQAEEVSRLMRESERLLLEITRVDRLVESQKQVEEELKKLIPPEQEGGGAAEEERARQREQLQAKQAGIRRSLEEMLAGQKENANLTVQQLQELLKNMPKQPMGGGGDSQKPLSPEEREKRLREKQEERKQHQPQAPRKPEDDPKKQQRSDKSKPPETPQEARMTRAKAWIAKLPPEDAERINRNDFSRIPSIYRDLVRDYTAGRAKRAAEEEKESDTER